MSEDPQTGGVLAEAIHLLATGPAGRRQSREARLWAAVCDRLEIATIRHVRAELVAARLTDDAEIDAHLAAVAAGELDLTLAPLISAWGRSPDP
jgi:hypothetical protein